MKTKISAIALATAAIAILFFYSCKKDEEKTLATVETINVTNYTATTAVSGGNVTDDGGIPVSSRGVVWGITQNPTLENYMGKTTDGTGKGCFTSKLTGLSPITTYFVRAYATNSVGTNYGNGVSFTTEGVTDFDGNVYAIVTIGTQIWMSENLRTTKYNDGTDIPCVTDGTAWGALTTGGYCSYNNTTNTDTIANYGRLYNWYAVNTGKLAPKGWHVPTDAEWTTLITYLGGNDAGGKLKENGTNHWSSPNTGATNETGFTALPGGYRNKEGKFGEVGFLGDWWTATETSTTVFLGCFIGYNGSNASSSYHDKEHGLSVRCVKD